MQNCFKWLFYLKYFQEKTIIAFSIFSFSEIVKVCKCMNNVFVQCDLWCEEMLRRVARPCCTCSRHVSSQALEDLIPLGPRVQFHPDTTKAFVPGLEVSVGPCPSISVTRSTPPPCPGMTPEAGPCRNLKRFTHTYFMHEAKHSIFTWPRHKRPSRLARLAHATAQTSNENLSVSALINLSPTKMAMSSADLVENCFKKCMEDSHKRFHEDDTRLSSSSNIPQTTLTASSSIDISSPSSGDLKKPFELSTFPANSGSQDLDADGSMQKARQDAIPHDNISRHSVLEKPGSSVSYTCESIIISK